MIDENDVLAHITTTTTTMMGYRERDRVCLSHAIRCRCAEMLTCADPVGAACEQLCRELRERGATAFFRVGAGHVIDLVHPRRLWPVVARVHAGVIDVAQACAECDRMQREEIYPSVRLYARRLARTDNWELAASFFADRRTRRPVNWVLFACVPWHVAQALQILLLHGCFTHRPKGHIAFVRTQQVEYGLCQAADLALRREFIRSSLSASRHFRSVLTSGAAPRCTRDALDGRPLLEDAGFVAPAPITGVSFVEKTIERGRK